MPIEITNIQRHDIPSAVICIQKAFDDDPYNNWAFDKRPGKFNAQRNFASLKAKCEWGIKHALFYVAKDSDSEEPDKVLGVSMWMKPRAAAATTVTAASSPPANQQPNQQSWSEWLDEYILWFKQGYNIVRYQGWGGLRISRYRVWKHEQAKAQSQLWTDPQGYYFCNIVTVLPGYQGLGIGRKLFDVVTDVADQEGKKCYLESSRDEPNTRIYGKMGFKLAMRMVCEEGGEKCDLFCMLREPVEGGQAAVDEAKNLSRRLKPSSAIEGDGGTQQRSTINSTTLYQLPHAVDRIGKNQEDLT